MRKGRKGRKEGKEREGKEREERRGVVEEEVGDYGGQGEGLMRLTHGERENRVIDGEEAGVEGRKTGRERQTRERAR